MREHRVKDCPGRERMCDNEKGDKFLSAVTQLVTSRDWYAGP
ncbi:hypothetical protein OIE71_02080 [Streptomyces sp. NBC_01725]|nr:hypothetical protein [Streptomyces sp. NBC_01725]